MKKSIFILMLMVCFIGGFSDAKTTTPPVMGWSSWNTFGININENLIRQQAEAMVKSGLTEAGYKYVNIDDSFWDGRASDGNLILNTKLFPTGMRSLTDYIHSLGLKAGIYSDAGHNTCASDKGKHASGRGVGFYGHEERDAKLYFDDWNFDFIKIDYCGAQTLELDEKEQYTRIAEAIKKCNNNNISLNICRWGYPGHWASDVADSWRTTGDIYCDWESVRSIINQNLNLQAYTRNGHYNDCDMLEIGRTLSSEEEKTHMAYWCITSSPLLIGCDLTTLPQKSFSLLTNPHLIAMNQDSLAIGAPVIQRQGDVYVVAKDIEKVMGPKRAIVIMNLGDNEETIDLDLVKAGFKDSVDVFDCFEGVDFPKCEKSMKITLAPHDSKAYFLMGNRIEKSVYQAEEGYLGAFYDMCCLENREMPVTGRPQSDSSADLGFYVEGIGTSVENYLEWDNIFSSEGGKYQLTFRYASPDPRSMTIDVNGCNIATLDGLSTGHTSQGWKTVSLEINLNKGINTIRVHNPHSFAPNLDYLSLVKMSDDINPN